MAAVLGIYNQIDSSTLSGTFNASYPVSNLKTRFLKQKARSTSTNWQIVIDLAGALNIGVVAVIASSMSATAVVRVEGSSLSNFSSLSYDSGTLPSYDHVDFAISFTPTAARYWRITISDPGNPAGYVEVGRVFIGNTFKPGNPQSWGATFGLDSSTAVVQALGGPEFFDERPSRRTTTFKWNWLTDAEAYSTLYPILKGHDISKEVFLIADDADTSFRATRNYLGRLKQLDKIANPYLGINEFGVEVLELL